MKTSFTSLRNFAGADRGAVAVMTAFALPVLLGIASLAAEFGHGLLTRTENQRIADQAAYAAAVAYSSTNSTTTMVSVAQNVAALNGVAASAVSATLVASSPQTSTDAAIKVTITTTDALLLAPVLGFGNALSIDASAYAQIPGAVGSCVLALNTSGTGITLSGGTSVTGNNCGVASNNSIVVPCGDTITAKDINYDGAAPTVSCPGGIVGSITKALTPDPLASNAGVVAAAARAVSDESLTGPTLSSVPLGTSISFDWTNSATAAATTVGCTASFSNPIWTLTCPAGGTYNFGSISLGGGITVNFNVNNSATYNFSGSINDSGSALTFGPGTFNVAQGVITGGGSTTKFGAGTFNIGAMTSNCGGVARYSVCNTGTLLSFGGPSTFNIAAGIYNGGGETISFGSGSTNSYSIGAANDGNALNFGGGSTNTFADATGSGDLFQVVGNLNETGGSCTTLPAAANHDINGNINFMGGLSLGSGLYAVTGYAGFGVSAGGDVWCSAANANVGVTGTGVTLAIAGKSEITSGSCANTAFCVGAGFNHLSLVAPSSGTYQNIAVVGPTATSNTAGVSMNEGASATDFGGALYFPYGPLTISGGASIGNVTGQCFQIVASQITLTGSGAATASQCFATTTTASMAPVLVE
jgi:Flp pilus assembly protein TadG